MFNSFMLNASKLNAKKTNTSIVASWDSTLSDDIIFNWYWLANEYVWCSAKNDDYLPRVNLISFNYPKADGGGVIDKHYTGRNVTLSGVIKKKPGMTLDETIDDFKYYISETEWYLDIKRQDGVYRRIKANVINEDIIKRQHYHIDTAPFDLQFQALEPFWYNRGEEVISIVDQSSDISQTFDYLGNAPSSPLVYIILQSEASVTSISLSVWVKEVTITEAFAAGDIILFDCEEYIVYRNWVSIERDGIFPVLEKWSNELIIDMNGTFLADVTVIYKAKYK